MSQLYDVAARFWEELVSRVEGPLAVCFAPMADMLFPAKPVPVKTACIARVEKHATRETQFIRRG
jgi:hypothetical protein